MRSVHLRAPSVAKGVQAFIWTVVFFGAIFLGGLAFGVSGGVSLLFALAAAFLIFLLIRTRGGNERS